ncbi:MAG: hypothetical protein M1834_002506 [Cirrosporium novae-zelandiae]|nr:MAG: hypothetical protein M1834_002506 [Cirrosporium novae-zelandiae]
MENLPPELIIHIAHYLEPLDIVRLQLVSKRFYSLSRDNKLWRSICFDKSQYEVLRRRRIALSNIGAPRPLSQITRRSSIPRNISQLAEVALSTLSHGPPQPQSEHGADRAKVPSEASTSNTRDRSRSSDGGRKRAMANWDPGHPSEDIDWYSEYVARHAPISMSWLQQPPGLSQAASPSSEARGVGLFRDKSDGGRRMAIAPLDDGSVCIWDVERSSVEHENTTKIGGVMARSNPHLLAADGIHLQKYAMAKMTFMGVDACVSIENTQKKAYFSIHDKLTEVDLETLQVVSEEKYPSFISALSPIQHPVPLTVGTSTSIHLYDPRIGSISKNSQEPVCERCDNTAFPIMQQPKSDFYSLVSGDRPTDYALLSEPGPLSIMHLPIGNVQANAGEIYVAGRFPSILIYDRRVFPKLRTTLHSGAQLTCLASLPHPFYSLEADLMKHAQLSVERVFEVKSKPGTTLIACGDYKGKGSLELYGLTHNVEQGIMEPIPAGENQISTYKNRQTASKSKLLSVANHGSRIVCSDGDGMIKWLERDAFTQVRRWNINPYQYKYFAPGGRLDAEVSHGDVARKILPTCSDEKSNTMLNDNLLIWTGERIGLLHFAQEPWFNSRDFEDQVQTTSEDSVRHSKEHAYGQTMRQALESHTNEMQFMSGLGLRDPMI